MKKALSLFLASVMLVSSIASFAYTVQEPSEAAKQEISQPDLETADAPVEEITTILDKKSTNFANPNGKLFVMSDAIPNEAISEAQEMFGSFVAAVQSNPEAFGLSTARAAEMSLGSGFTAAAFETDTAAEAFYFPVLSGNEILRVIVVVKDAIDGNYYAQTSGDLIEELNALRFTTSETNPALVIVSENGYLTQYKDQDVEVLSVSRIVANNDPDTISDLKDDQLKIADVASTVSLNKGRVASIAGTDTAPSSFFELATSDMEMVAIDSSNIIQKAPKMSGRATQNSFMITGLTAYAQGANSWCWAASIATIVRYVSPYVNPTMQDVVQRHVGWLNPHYGLALHAEPTVFGQWSVQATRYNRALTWDEATASIERFEPPYMHLTGYHNTAGTQNHAVVLMGYARAGTPSVYYIIDSATGYIEIADAYASSSVYNTPYFYAGFQYRWDYTYN